MKAPTFDPGWTPEVMALYHHDVQEIWDRSISPHVWNQYHNQLDCYLDLAGRNGGLDILDVGCAQATLAIKLAEAGHRVTAMDIRPEFLRYASARVTHGKLNLVAGNVLEAPLEGPYDLIFANQIVEHLVYPRALVSRLRSAMKDGGRLVVTTPNWEYCRMDLPSYSQLGNPDDWAHRQHSADADGHFYAYRASELEAVFRDCGLADVSARFFESPWISGHMKIRYLHRWVPVEALHWLDRLTLALPFVGRKCAHQLLVVGHSPSRSE